MFAVFCVAILLMTSCQVMFVGVDAMEGDSDNSSSAVPAYPPVGTVDNIGGEYDLTVSPPQEVVSRPYVTVESYGICYWTPNGTYIFDKTNPEKMSLTSLSGNQVVSEAYFTVEAQTKDLIVSDASVYDMADDFLRIHYSLQDASTLEKYAEMDVTYEFFVNKPPKITASATSIEEKVDWRVVWTIIPSKDASLITSDVKGSAVALSELVGTKLPVAGLKATLDVGKDYVDLDWTDAGSGSLGIDAIKGKDRVDNALKVRFRNETAVIDPTIVTSSSNNDPTGYATQRKVSWYGGYFWLFYNSGSAICYRTSIDGISWSSEVSLPEGTTPSMEGGFDVAMRNGHVLVGWSDTINHLQAKKGTILGRSIIWSSKHDFGHTLGSGEYWGNTVSVAIGYDNSLWISERFLNYSDAQLYAHVLKCLPDSWPSFSLVGNFFAMHQGGNGAFVLLPSSNGDISIIETGYSSSNTTCNGYIRAYHYWSSSNSWSNTVPAYVGIYDGSSPTYTVSSLSAVASYDGTVHIAFIGSAQSLKYLAVSALGTFSSIATLIGGYCSSPTICLDDNGDLRVFFEYTPTVPPVYFIQCITKTKNSGSWSNTYSLYSNAYTYVPKGLTAWMNPTGVVALAWAENSGSSRTIKFGNIPLPFGTPGATANPWNREGISPYGTYFSNNGDYISPGSGQLTVVQQDVSVPGRNGVDLSISRMYQQPKYFDKSDGMEYGYKQFPFCNMGRYWSLSLPWVDQNYVYLSNGQRFIIQWGNEGKSNEFVNHDSVHFTMRDVVKTGRSFYEITTSSGMRYEFEHTSPFKLTMISDLKGYNSDSPTYAAPLNNLMFGYDGNNLISITDSGLGRSITLSYTTDGFNLLSRITAPDGSFTDLSYSQYNYKKYLTSVIDPANRATQITYDPNADYCLSSILYPSGGKTQYSYAVDNSPATEVRSWMVTSEAIRATATNELIRQTSFDYKIANGKVSMTTRTDYDELGVAQGSVKYIFQSALMYQDTITLNSTGSQMQRSRTWFDALGQPVRVDSYLGDSVMANHSTYSGYDDWGNLIYTRDALGHESYLSYGKTSTQNSFQGGCVLDRAISGMIFYEAFDEWEWSSWIRNMGDASNTLDTGLDAQHSPAMKIDRFGNGGEAYLEHIFNTQSGDLVIQTSLMSNLEGEAKIQVFSGTTERLAVSASGTTFQYWNNGYWVVIGSCTANRWYDLAVSIHQSTNTYDIYIDGSMVASGLTLLNSGNIYKIRFNNGPNPGSAHNIMWFDNVRIYKGLTVTVNDLDPGYILELYDSKNTLIARSRTNSVSFSAPPLYAPPAYMVISKIGGRSYSTPIMDIWGGDAYSIDIGLFSSAISKTGYGFGASISSMPDDDGFPAGSYIYHSAGEGYTGAEGANRWVSDPNYAVSGTSYHQSTYVTGLGMPASHYHGWKLPTTSGEYMHIRYSTDYIVQYVWLEDGKIPQEISIQYFVDGTWRRAYWGGGSSNENLIMMEAALNSPSSDVWMGDVPTITGKWLQLVIMASDLGIGNGANIYGIVYSLYGGTARWDFASTYGGGVRIDGLTSGMTAKMNLDGGRVISRTASGSSVFLDAYSDHERVFPTTCNLEFYSANGSLLYVSPEFTDVYSGDTFQYSPHDFYANVIKGDIHNSLVAVKGYQDYDETISQEGYFFYDFEGNPVIMKTKADSGWLFATSTFDPFGNLRSSTDENGHITFYRYSSETGYIYLDGTKGGGKVDSFESDAAWQGSRSSTNGDLTWLTAQYSTAQSYSPTKSLQLSFTSGPVVYDTGVASMSKEYSVNEVSSLSLKMYCAAYSHGGGSWDTMDSGLRMKLYDSSGNNYATYTYWLACWDNSSDIKTAPDANTKVIYGKPAMNTWLNVALDPNADFNIDWSNCDRVRFELYAYGSGTYGDSLTLYFDDFAYDDTAVTSAISEPPDNIVESFENDASWAASKSSSNGNVAWLTAQYGTVQSHSPSHSLQASFTSGPDTYDTGTATFFKDFDLNSISNISVWLRCTAYSHNGGIWDTMDSGIRMKLYDSVGNNYATYTYWLACWEKSSNTKTAPNANTKVVYGQPTMNTWLNVTLNPNTDFSIDWSNCDRVRFELYAYGSGTVSDSLTLYFDDFSVNGISGLDSVGMTEYSYDNRNGRILSITDPLGHVTSNQYDILGRVIRTNNSDGTYTTAQYDDAANKVTTYDELNHRIISYYDEIGRLTKVERYGVSASVYSSQTYSYNWQDKIKTVTDELGRVTEYDYDYLGRSTVTRYLSGTSTTVNSVDNFESDTSWTAYKYASTSPTWLTAQYSTAQSYSPTKSLQLSFTSGPPSYDTGIASMSKEYSVNEVTSLSLKMFCAAYSHNGGSWDTMDSGLRIRLIDANGANYATYTYWLACWDKSSNTKTAPDANTKVIYGKPTMNTWLDVALNPSTDFSINWSSCDKVKFELYTYGSGTSSDSLMLYFDDFGMNGVANEHAKRTTIYDDKNLQVTSIDENGNKVVSVLDYLGRLNATREYYSPTAFYQTLLSYDAVGNLRTVRAANGEVTRMSYDVLNRETSIIYPDSTTESWSYNNVGQVTEHWDGDDKWAIMNYDTVGRTIRIKSSDDTYSTRYDQEGRAVESRNNLGKIAYQYNDRDLVSRVTETIGGTSYSFTYSYDDAGKVTSVGYPDSSTVSYIYDDYGRVSQVKVGNTQLLSLTYNLDDSLASKSLCNGNSTVSYSYNYRGWISSIAATDSGNNSIMNLGYFYDIAGNVKSIVDAVGSAGIETYTYDALDRLTRATGAWGTIQYGYDSVGNRLWMNDGTNRSFSYTTYNKLTSDGTWSYDYDKSGNVAWKNSTAERYHYVYNSFSQMTSVKKSTDGGSSWSTVATYSYDANGQRARTIEGSVVTNFVYQGIDTECQFGSDGKVNKYIYVGGQLQLRTCSADESYAYIADALGSSRLVLKNGNADAANVVYSAVTYKPFGAVYSSTGSDRITFAGETTDSPTGLVYLSARYYDPAIGRFMALDPELGSLSVPQTMNRYVYCVNNPLVYTDPSGRVLPLAYFGAILASGLAFGTANAVMAYATGGDVVAAFAGGFVEGALLLTPLAPAAGAAGGVTQSLMEDGEIDEMDALFIGIAALPGPNIPSKSLVRNAAGELGQDAVQRKLYDLVPIAERNVASRLDDKAVKDLIGMSLQARNSKLGNWMHDEMGELAKAHGIPYTKRGLSGPDFDLRDEAGFWFDLSTHNTWPKRANYGPNGYPIFYDPGEVLNCYNREFRR